MSDYSKFKPNGDLTIDHPRPLRPSYSIDHLRPVSRGYGMPGPTIFEF